MRTRVGLNCSTLLFTGVLLDGYSWRSVAACGRTAGRGDRI
jgi:hypothetical protein